MKRRIAKVVFNIPVDKAFDYLIPSDMPVYKGSRVLINFNRRKTAGIVISISGHTDINSLKPVLNVLEDAPLLSSESIGFAKRLIQEYPYSLGEIVFMLLHPYLRSKKRINVPYKIPSRANDREAKGYKKIIRAISFNERFDIYKDDIKKALASGSVMIFFPTVDYLNNACSVIEKFFPSIVPIYSRQDYKSGLKNWFEAKRGKALIAGTRGALFYYPCDLRLVIIEEDSSPHYFHPEKPYYNLIDAARILCRYKHASLIISSDYPALSTYKEYKEKKIAIEERPEKRKSVEVFDFNSLFTKGSKVFTPFVIELMRKSLQDNNRILILWSRRNFSLFLKCTKCGYVMQCPHCSTPLKFSLDKTPLPKEAERPIPAERYRGVCSSCGRSYDIPEVCPKCNTGYIKPVGVGIERLGSIVKRIFPEWKADEINKADDGTRIFLSTSKVVNYISYKYKFNVVFILDIDRMISRIDYDSTFNAFLYLKRASRMSEGKTYVFTHNPEYYIWSNINKEWKYFYNDELILRKKFNFPPYGKLVKLTLKAKNKDNLFKKAQDLYNIFRRYTSYAFGPMEESPFKLRDKYRYSIIVQFKKKREALKTVNSVISEWKHSSIRLAVEIK